jgi:ABC-type amino acid transport substrate-binding protein
MAFTKAAKKGIGLLVTLAIVGGGIYAFQSGKFGHTQSSAIEPVSNTRLSEAPAPAPSDYKPSKDTLNSILANHVVRVSVQNPSEPIYGETNGIPHGFNVDFAKLLFAQPEFAKEGPVSIDTHHEVEAYKDVPRQLLVNNDGRSTVDIAMDGLTFPDDTPAGVIYTNPYLDDFGYALIVRDGSNIRSASDVGTRTLGILQGDPDVKAFVQRQFPNANVVQINDSDPHFIDKSLDTQRVDAFVYDYPFAVESIKGTDLKFAVTKLDGSDISYKIGVRAADQNLLVYLNSAIGRVKNSPAYNDLLRKYFVSAQVVTTAAKASERSYTVKQGDTLNLIASAQLGQGSRYVEIQKRNNLPNPNLIMVGQVLVLPSR